MTYKGKPPWPGCEDPPAKELLKRYPDYDLIVTGHNHQSFVEELDGRLLVNPGAITRQEADKADHKPCVYLWYAEENQVEPHYLPVEEGVISREHIEQTEERNERIEAFVSRLNDEWEAGLSFEQNLERFFKENEIRQSVQEIIWGAIEQ
jgi:DNA repair exonuclease SbcCD nuclease subunit